MTLTIVIFGARNQREASVANAIVPVLKTMAAKLGVAITVCSSPFDPPSSHLEYSIDRDGSVDQ